MKEKGRNIYDHFIAQDLLSLSADRAGVCYKSGLPEGEQQTISEYF